MNTTISNQWLWAQDAIRRGWFIFPCEPGDKRGALVQPGSPYRIQWYESATNNIDLAAAWWEYQPEYNIGISAKKSGLLIVDCDTPKTDSVQDHGEDQYRRLVESQGHDWTETRDTYIVETPSKGVHYYYLWPGAVKASQRSLDTLLDVRTNGGDKGGYVVGAGSVTPSGPYNVPDGVPSPVQDAPAWLVELVRAKEPKRRLDEPLGGRRGNRLDSFFDEYHGLRNAVLTAAEGNRNETLNWAAHQMAKDGCTEDKILAELYSPARANFLEETEVRRTIHSAWSANRGAS